MKLPTAQASQQAGQELATLPDGRTVVVLFDGFTLPTDQPAAIAARNAQHAGFALTVKARPPVAVVTGGERLVSLAAGAPQIVLDATASSSPDRPGASFRRAFLWQCAQTVASAAQIAASTFLGFDCSQVRLGVGD